MLIKISYIEYESEKIASIFLLIFLSYLYCQKGSSCDWYSNWQETVQNDEKICCFHRKVQIRITISFGQYFICHHLVIWSYSEGSLWRYSCWMVTWAMQNEHSEKISHLYQTNLLSVCWPSLLIWVMHNNIWPVCSLGKTLLAFALLHSALQGQIYQLLQVFLDFLLLHSSPL